MEREQKDVRHQGDSAVSVKEQQLHHPAMDFPTRKHTRLKHWDYSNPGCYHITVCAHRKEMIFGEVVHPDEGASHVELSRLGGACDDAIASIPAHFPGVVVCNHIVMPNHVHMLILLQGEDAPKLGRVVSYVKATVTRAAREESPSAVVWQGRYYEHILRDEDDFRRTWEYIDENPEKWDNDEYYW